MLGMVVVLGAADLAGTLNAIVAKVAPVILIIGGLGFMICAIGMALGVTGKRELITTGAAVVIGASAMTLANMLGGSS